MASRYIISSQASHILCLRDAEMVPAFKRNSFGSGSSFMGPAASSSEPPAIVWSGTHSFSVPRWESSSLFNQKDNLATENWLTELNILKFFLCFFLRGTSQTLDPNGASWFHGSVYSTVMRAALVFGNLAADSGKSNKKLNHNKTWRNIWVVHNIIQHSSCISSMNGNLLRWKLEHFYNTMSLQIIPASWSETCVWWNVTKY